jgi:hypothetical protein
MVIAYRQGGRVGAGLAQWTACQLHVGAARLADIPAVRVLSAHGAAVRRGSAGRATAPPLTYRMNSVAVSRRPLARASRTLTCRAHRSRSKANRSRSPPSKRRPKPLPTPSLRLTICTRTRPTWRDVAATLTGRMWRAADPRGRDPQMWCSDGQLANDRDLYNPMATVCNCVVARRPSMDGRKLTETFGWSEPLRSRRFHSRARSDGDRESSDLSSVPSARLIGSIGGTALTTVCCRDARKRG